MTAPPATLLELARMRATLVQCRDWLTSAPLESGYCCCGSPVESHGIGDGHSPVDDLAYSAWRLVEAIDAALPPAPQIGQDDGDEG